MADKLVDFLFGAVDVEQKKDQYSIAPGIVENNRDLLSEGRVQVRIPSRPAFSPWARLLGLGAGAGKGFFWVPQLKDEVLVAFNQNDERDAYILGGLWSMIQRPPVSVPVVDPLRKRVIKTGLIGGTGHEIEFDDALQSITITSSTRQKISINPKSIEINAALNTMTITLSILPPCISIEYKVPKVGNMKLTLGTKPSPCISIENNLPLGNIELKAPQGKISLEAPTVEVKALGPCVIQGLPVKIN